MSNKNNGSKNNFYEIPKRVQKMIAYPTEYEVIIEGDSDIQAKFTMFDNEAFEVEIKTIMDGDDLREIADLLDAVLELNKKGVDSE